MTDLASAPARPWLRACLFALLALSGTATAQPPATDTAATGNSATQLDTARQLLDWLGVNALLDQTPQIADLALQGEARFADASPAKQATWRRQLGERINPTTLRERAARDVAAQVDAAALQQALTLLQAPLPRRARYFELAMAQAGAGLGFKAFREGAEPAPSPARRQLARDLVGALYSAELMAVWQTSLSAAAMKLAGTGSGRPDPDAVRERTLHLAPLAETHALYTYRFLTDAELGTYRDTLKQAAIQQILGVCRRNLGEALID